MKVVRAWDTEFVAGSGYLRGVNPFHPDSWVVSHAWGDYSREGFMAGGQKVPMTPVIRRYYTERPADGWFAEVIDGVDLLCGANIKIDLHMALWQQPKNYEAYRRWVANGGRVWDVLQAEFLLEGHHESAMHLSLEEVAARYGGSLKHDQVKAMIKNGTPVNQIPRTLLDEYLCGVYDEHTCEHGDIGNTLLAAIHQIQEARKQKLLPWMKVEMLALLCTTEMELNGSYVDWPQAEEARQRAVEALQAAQETLRGYIPDPHPDAFSWGSWRDKSRLLYGGVKEIEVPGFKNIHGEDREKLWPPMLQDYASETFDVCSYDDEGKPILNKGGLNAGMGKTKKVKGKDLSRPKTRKTIRQIVFPRRIEPAEGTEASEEGFWKTDAETMEHLPEGDEVVAAIRAVTTWMKDISVSYYSLGEDGTKKGGIYEGVMPDGIIHPQFIHNGTISGRLSSRSPNFQNLSKVGEIKTCLTSRYPGGVIVQGDATSLENYVMLWLSGCKGYFTLISEGLDVHSYVACAGDKEAALALKARVDAGDKEAKQIRQDAKGVNFSMGYGGGVKSIAYKNQMSEERVKEMMEGNRAAFADYWAFQDGVYEHASSHVTYTGDLLRHPLDPRKLWRAGYGTWKGPHGPFWRYPLTPTPAFVLERSGATESVSPTQAKNLHVQGTGAHYMKAALALAILAYLKNPSLAALKLIATVHDALYADAPAHLKEQAGVFVQGVLMAANGVLTKAGVDVMIPVPAVTTVGPCWKEMPGDTTVDKDSESVVRFVSYLNSLIPEIYA